MSKTHRRPTTQDAIDNLTFAPGKSPSIGDLMKSDGFFEVGDGGKGTWEHEGVTGQTPSQSPKDLDDKLFNDPSGNQWAMILDNDFEFETFAEIELSNIGNVGQRLICRERANAEYIIRATTYTKLSGDATLASGLDAELQTGSTAKVNNFGALQNAQTGFEAARTRAQESLIPFDMRSGDYTLTAKIVFDASVAIISDGFNRLIIRVNDFVGPIFELNVIGSDRDHFTFDGCKVIATYSGAQTDCQLIEITGDNLTWMRWSTFKNIIGDGIRTIIKNTKATRTTSFGEESFVAWCTFENIYPKLSNNIETAVVYVFDWQTGSGTGNTFSQIQGMVSNVDGAFWRYTGAGNVVGDICIDNCQGGRSPTGGGDGGAFMEVGDNTAYRQNVTFSNCQVDADLLQPLKLSQVGSDPYVDWKWIGNNNGGGTTFDAGLPLFTGSMIFDRSVCDMRVSRIRNVGTIDSGAQLLNVAKIEMGNFDGATVELTLTGLIDGSSAFTFTEVWHVRTNSTVITRTSLGAVSTPAVGMTADVVVTDQTALVQLSFNPSGPNSKLDAQVKVIGNHIKLSRI